MAATASVPTKPCGCPVGPVKRPKPKLQFHCQLAHGSPTGVISGFTNVKELYKTIAECYDLEPSAIMFVTLNTHKPDMNRLLGGQLGLEDFIFAHIKGRPKAVTLKKVDDALGVTITDNGAGYAFIKRIREGTTIAEIEGICPGDLIEKVNNETVVGLRHFQVAKILKDMPKGSEINLRLIEPEKTGFSEIASRPVYKGGSVSSKKKSGKETLRLRARGVATVEIPDDIVEIAIAKINSLLETFMGISDTELAQSIWEIGNEKDNPHDFALVMDRSDLEQFAFTDEFIFDIWGSINDAKLSSKLSEFEGTNGQF